MSKSMNKYHKCMSELGRSMSGWVKVGALALGVGMGTGGVPVPGGGVSKAWAGRYSISFCDGKKPGSFYLCGCDFDAGTSVKIEVWPGGWKALQGEAPTVFSSFQSNDLCFSYRLGAFVSCFNYSKKTWVLYGGSKDDTLAVMSNKELLMPQRNRVSAAVLSFSGMPRIEIGSYVHASIVCFSNCKDICIQETGALLCDDGFFVSDSSMLNNGKIQCGSFFSYGNTHSSGEGVISSCFSPGCYASFQGIDDPFNENGFVSSGDNVPCWTNFVSSTELPLRNVSAATSEGKRFLVKSGDCGKYYFIFICKIKDGCDIQHEKEVSFCLKDSSGAVLAESAMGVQPGRWNSIACALCATLGKANEEVSFNLSNVVDPQRPCNHNKISLAFPPSVFIFKAL